MAVNCVADYRKPGVAVAYSSAFHLVGDIKFVQHGSNPEIVDLSKPALGVWPDPSAPGSRKNRLSAP